MSDRPLGYERVYLPLYKVADTPFHFQGDILCSVSSAMSTMVMLLRELSGDMADMTPLALCNLAAGTGLSQGQQVKV